MVQLVLMAGEKKFKALYQQLNAAQKEAVDTVEGTVMVTAGPGTGKTQVLTLRIANILRVTDIAPENILALTFTESGVASMRRRLAEIVGSPAYAVTINTFHSFCNDIIKSYPEYFPRIIGSRPITEVDQVTILEKLITETELELLRPFGEPLLYTRPVLSAINDLKREGWTPGAFSQLVEEEQQKLETNDDLRHRSGPYQGRIKGKYQKMLKDLGKNTELAKLYAVYEEYLTENRLYDYSDMIMEVLQTLTENHVLLQVLQEEYQYILLDEHQDTNNAQNRIVEMLASFHEDPNLFVVGDDKQAIFRFQGASLENFLYFQRRFPGARLISLTDNYRSAGSILSAAENVIPGPKPLEPRAGFAPEPIRLVAFDDQLSEHHFVLSKIRSEIAQGVPPENIAILYRDNKDALPLARLAEKLGVAVVIESDQDLLSQLDVRKLLLILEAVERFGQDEPLAAVMHIDIFGLDPLEVYRLVRKAKQLKKPLVDLVSQSPATASFYQKLSQWRQESKNLDLLTFLERMIRGSGVFEDIIASGEAEERFGAISRFYDEVAGLLESDPEAGLSDFFRYLDTVRKHNLLIKRNKTTGQVGRVRLMTVHRSKGLEFDQVYIIGAYDGHFGGRRRRELLKLLPEVYRLSGVENDQADSSDFDPGSDDLADERRLFYVALTRARKKVMISYSQFGQSGREQLPSAFIAEMGSDHLEEIVPEDRSLSEASALELKLTVPEKTGRSLASREFVQEVFFEQGLSVSALNNYLVCPWRFFYRNLVRLPEAQSQPQMYGTAVHQALADLFRAKVDREFGKDSFLAAFDTYLRSQPLTQNDYERFLKRGNEALAGWYDTYQGTWLERTKTEFNITGVLLTPEIRLTGKLDKIEFLEQDQAVRVVDYKTGRPKSRKAILGETKSEDGDYYRQLIFYRLLLDLYDGGRYKMRSGMIDFVEPNDKGQYKREEFVIESEEVDELSRLVKTVAGEIISLDFWDRRCEDPGCYYCGLRAMLK